MLISGLWLIFAQFNQGYAFPTPNGYNCSVVNIGIVYG